MVRTATTEKPQLHRIPTASGHEIRYRGTRAQAEAYAALQGVHDTDPRWAELYAVLYPR